MSVVPQRTLEGGGAAKALLDAVLDAASAMQNLREAIAGYRGRLMQESVEEKRNALLQARHCRTPVGKLLNPELAVVATPRTSVSTQCSPLLRTCGPRWAHGQDGACFVVPGLKRLTDRI